MAEKKTPGGRNRRFWEPSEEDLQKITAHAGRGLTQEQIALVLGIQPETLSRKKCQFDQIDQAIKRGNALGVSRMTNALFEAGLGGNVTAQIFYLKNRDPESWRDRQDVRQDVHHHVAAAALLFQKLGVVAPDGESDP